LFLLASLTLCGQQLDLSSLDRLEGKAKEKARVSLDTNALRMASKFLSADDAGEQQTKDLVGNLRGIFVRTYEFAAPGEYTRADLDAVRDQLRAPGWSKIIDVQDSNDSAEIYFFSQNNQYGGLAVIAAEPREVAVVNIVGPIDINALAKLSGSLGIPAVHVKALGGKSKDKEKDKRDDDNE
jgi:hypothetical protein